MSNKTQFLSVIVLVLAIGAYCIKKIQNETDYLHYMHSVHMPQIASDGFLVGCIYSHGTNPATVFECQTASDAYKYEVKMTMELKGDENNR